MSPSGPEDPSTGPAATRGDWEELDPEIQLGVVAGGLALLVALTSLDLVTGLPAGGLVLHGVLIWGVVSLARMVAQLTPASPDQGWVAACTPALAIPLLGLAALGAQASLVPRGLAFGLVAELVLMGATLGLIGSVARRWPHRTPTATGAIAWAGGSLAIGFLAVHVLRHRPATGSLTIVGLAMGITAVLLAGQWLVATLQPRIAPLATAAALVVAGAHLLDGLVAFLAVLDPLGLAPRTFTEQTPLSALLLSTVGLGYPMLKWALGWLVTYVFDVRGPEEDHGPITRWAGYLFTIQLGLGPALFSLLRVLEA